MITRLRLAGIKRETVPGLQQVVSTCTRLGLGVPLPPSMELPVHLLNMLLISPGVRC